MPQANWRNASDYYYTRDHTPDLWAWEFLRRNVDYCREYQQFKPQETATNTGDASHWGLRHGYIDPEVDTHLGIVFDKPFGELLMAGMKVPIGSMAITFNPSLPPEPQFEYAKKVLMKIQKPHYIDGKTKDSKGKEVDHLFDDLKPPVDKRNPKPRPDNFVLMLRIWDAEQSSPKPKPKDIAKTLFPNYSNTYPDYQGTKQVRDHRNPARRYIEGAYLDILTDR